MSFTNDQYNAFNKMNKWYDKYSQQFFEISGTIETGIWECIQSFLDYNDIDQRNVMYLSFDQKQTLELALKGYHSYYIYPAIYKFQREVNFDTIPILNYHSQKSEIKWKKKIRNKLPREYQLIVIFDSILMNKELVRDVSSFGIPVLLIRDNLLFPSADSLIYFKEPNVTLYSPTEKMNSNPIFYFANRIKNKQKLTYGSFNGVNIIPKKQMSMYNLKSADMILTLTDELRNEINKQYREKILNNNDSRLSVNERIICKNTLWSAKLVNKDNSKVKVYLTNGLIGTLSRVPRHALTTKFINVDIKPEFYHDSFEEIDINRFYPNNINIQSRQLEPDEYINIEYAYALPISIGRYTHFDNVTFIIEDNSLFDDTLYQMALYSGISRARKNLTIVI